MGQETSDGLAGTPERGSEQTKAPDTPDHERQGDPKVDADAVLTCANQLRKAEGLGTSQLTGTLAS